MPVVSLSTVDVNGVARGKAASIFTVCQQRRESTAEITSPGYFQSKIRSPVLGFHCDSVGIDREVGGKGEVSFV